MALILELKLFELLASSDVCTERTFLIGTQSDTVGTAACKDFDTFYGCHNL